MAAPPNPLNSPIPPIPPNPPHPPVPQVEHWEADTVYPPFHVYAIARLAGHYRCLGGVCCPKPYEATEMESLALVLRRIFSDVSNRIPLVLELELGSDFYARRGYPPPQTSPSPSPAVPEEQPPCFPFIHTCLCVGSVSPMEHSYRWWNEFGESVFPLSADEILGNCPVRCFESLPTPSGRGMSVIFIDVTDPTDIRHRFATWKPTIPPKNVHPSLRNGSECLLTDWSLPFWSVAKMQKNVYQFKQKDWREMQTAPRIELGAIMGEYIRSCCILSHHL